MKIDIPDVSDPPPTTNTTTVPDKPKKINDPSQYRGPHVRESNLEKDFKGEYLKATGGKRKKRKKVSKKRKTTRKKSRKKNRKKSRRSQ